MSPYQQQPKGRRTLNVQSRSGQILIHGLALVLAGLVWGIVVPHSPFPRLALVAHIQFAMNGMLFILMAVLLLAVSNRVTPRATLVMLVAVWLTWPMFLSQIANAWWGTREILPIAAQQAGAIGGTGWQEILLTLTHVSGGLAALVAWILLLRGFVGNTHTANPPKPRTGA